MALGNGMSPSTPLNGFEIKEVSLLDEKHILKLFPLSSCQYVSTIPEEKLHVTDV